jgi:glycosyltransferase involved in cell wall biosynthesis
MNPSRYLMTDYVPARVTICLLVYIPEQIGYFAHRFEVLKLCLQSILKHTDKPYDLMVFDNGSCPEVVDYLRSLRDQSIIDYLIISARNVGIHEALRIMFNAAMGEVIAYSQDDVLFYPGWLYAHLEVLDNFPKVGMVSGAPVREQFQTGNKYLQTYLSDFPEISIEYGHFIPDEWEKDFYASTGGEVEKEIDATRRAYQDIVVEYKGIKAYSTAVHFQYVVRKAVILQGLSPSWDGRMMVGPDLETDQRIDSLGYARLSTYHRYVRHIGNVITSDLKESVSSLGLEIESEVWTPPPPFLVWLAQQRIVRGILRRLSNCFFFLLNYRR